MPKGKTNSQSAVITAGFVMSLLFKPYLNSIAPGCWANVSAPSLKNSQLMIVTMMATTQKCFDMKSNGFIFLRYRYTSTARARAPPVRLDTFVQY